MIKKLLNKIKSIILHVKSINSLMYSEDLKLLIKQFKTYKDKHYKFITDPGYVNLKEFKSKLKKYAKTKVDNTDLLEAIEDKEYLQVVHHAVKGDLVVGIAKGDSYKNLPSVATTEVKAMLQANAINQYGLMVRSLGDVFIEKLYKDYTYIMGRVDSVPEPTKPEIDLTKELAQDLKEIHRSPKKEVFDECFVTIFPVI